MSTTGPAGGRGMPTSAQAASKIVVQLNILPAPADGTLTLCLRPALMHLTVTRAINQIRRPRREHSSHSSVSFCSFDPDSSSRFLLYPPEGA